MTLGIGEPFTTTLTVTLMFALILSLPVLLTQIYAFFMPALGPEQRRQTRALLLAIPFQFIVGVAFGYFVVLPAALRFFQNFNSDQFNVLVQASQYYKFAATTLLAMGLLFQVPVGILAITRAGVLTPRQLRRNRRYAIAACALVAAVLPGDAITMLLETVPLYLLFEAGVLLASIADRRSRKGAAARQPPALKPSPGGRSSSNHTCEASRPVPQLAIKRRANQGERFTTGSGYPCDQRLTRSRPIASYCLGAHPGRGDLGRARR